MLTTFFSRWRVCSGVRLGLPVVESCWAGEVGGRGSVGGGGMAILILCVMCYYGRRWCVVELMLL